VLVIAALIGVLTLLVASPALAKAPEVSSWEESWANQPLYDCGDFTLLESVHNTYDGTKFFDKAGNPVRWQVRFSYDGTLTNSVTGATVTDAPDHQLYVRDYGDGTLTIHGLVLSANIPGVGVIGLDAGTTVFDADWNIVFQSGPHHVWLPGYGIDYTAICDFLR
jgi:hypothetical protein